MTGEPGCGKTELGHFLSWRLGLGPEAIRVSAKTDSQTRDLFYTYDMVGRFHAAQSASLTPGAPIEPRRFIRYHGLGMAIVLATKPGTYADLLPPDFEHPEQRRSVVLIDEIDKAPRDVPNDLLDELEKRRFHIPELSYAEITADPAFWPILVLTSNSEKALPDAFLRRCVYYHMPFPDPDTLHAIVAARLTALPQGGDLVSDAIAVMRHLRTKRRLRKSPGVAELLGFLRLLLEQGYRPVSRLEGDQAWLPLAAYTMLKAKEDQQGQAEHLHAIDWTANRNDGP